MYQLKLIKIRAELANINVYKAPFSSRAAANLRWYYYNINNVNCLSKVVSGVTETSAIPLSYKYFGSFPSLINYQCIIIIIRFSFILDMTNFDVMER